MASFENPAAPGSAPPRPEPRRQWLVYSALLLAPIGFLSVRHSIEAAVFLLTMLAAFDLAKNPVDYRLALGEPGIKTLLLAFAALFLATAVTQAIRLQLYWPAFDGPSRILLAALVFLFLRTRTVAFARILELGLPLGLLAVYLAIRLYPDTSAAWGGRFATRFVDPNSLGSQSLILTMLCLFSIRLPGKEAPWLLLLKIVGIAAGITVAIHAESRGGWLAIPPLLALWLVLYFSGSNERRAWLFPVVLLAIAVLAMVLGYEYSPIIAERINLAHRDIGDWFSGRNLDSAVGIRLSMWKISLFLAQGSPWFGYGEIDLKPLLAGSPFAVPAYRSAIDLLGSAGPHSDALAKLLTMGVIGLSAFIATLAIPWTYFWRRRRDARPVARAASHLGLYFVTGVFVCGLANELLSLKYLCSFYGLMIAGLGSDIAKRSR